MDVRHQKRIKIIQNLYASSFSVKKNNFPYKNEKDTLAIIKKIDDIDSLIVKYASKFPVKRIVKTDLAILRWAIFELKYQKKLPVKVVVNEAIELAKELSAERPFAFVNAVLGKILDEQAKIST